MTKTIVIAVVAIVAIAAGVGIYFMYGGGGGDKDSSDDPVVNTVVDGAGREIAIPSDLKKGIVTVGSSGPLRFASMFDVFDNIIEVDKGDITDNRNGRAYSYAYGYNTMKVETQSHPDNSLEAATVESIAKKNPAVVITTLSLWNNNIENFNILAKNCTVVVLKNQEMKYMTEDGKLAEYLTFNINLLGKVFKDEPRAKELVNGIGDIVNDLGKLKKTSEKKVYVAGVTINGSNTLNTTFPTYMPFTLDGIKNAYDGGSTENRVTMNIEDFTKLDIDMIVVDPSSSDKIDGNMDSQKVLEFIYGINNDSDAANDIPIYVTVPIVWDSINYDCALASAYYLQHLVYGSLSHDDVVKKINNVFTVFYGDNGKDVLSDMMEFFVGKSSSNGQTMPVLGQVKIVKNGDSYSFAAA